MIFFSHY